MPIQLFNPEGVPYIICRICDKRTIPDSSLLGAILFLCPTCYYHVRDKIFDLLNQQKEALLKKDTEVTNAESDQPKV